MSALTGIRIVELAESVAGEYCGKLLADFGAEVIKVEGPGGGSPTRAMSPIVGDVGGPERSALFAYLNTNKRSVELDVSCADQIDVLHTLIATADAVVDDHSPRWTEGAMSGAETDLWDGHLDQLLHLFVAEVHRCGGPDLSVHTLHDQIMLYVGTMAVAWLLDVPALIRFRFGDVAHTLTRKNSVIKDDESVRAPLQMLTNALNLWETKHFGHLIDEMLKP